MQKHIETSFSPTGFRIMNTEVTASFRQHYLRAQIQVL